MLRILSICSVLIAMSASAFAATLNSKDCPDPICCRPSRGPSACYVGEDPCSATCRKTCPCGIQITCAHTSRLWISCMAGEPNAGETPCYTRDQPCDDFLAANDPCMDPHCWDIELVGGLCDDVCKGID